MKNGKLEINRSLQIVYTMFSVVFVLSVEAYLDWEYDFIDVMRNTRKINYSSFFSTILKIAILVNYQMIIFRVYIIFFLQPKLIKFIEFCNKFQSILNLKNGKLFEIFYKETLISFFLTCATKIFFGKNIYKTARYEIVILYVFRMWNDFIDIYYMLPISFYLSFYEKCLENSIEELQKNQKSFEEIYHNFTTNLKIHKKLQETFGYEISFVIIQCFIKITFWVRFE